MPQWNCACRVCTLARSGDPRVVPRSQASVAVSADGEHWTLIGASPDLRQQILQTPALAPRAPRHSPIAAVVLPNAEIDGIAGLLTLREGHVFRLVAPAPVLGAIGANPIFAALRHARPTEARVDAPIALDGGLTVRLLPLPGKTPLYAEAPDATAAEPDQGYAVGLEAGGSRLLIAPAVAAITPELRDAVATSNVVLFDGTLFTDDEMRAIGIGQKTARRMGHVPISAPDGPLAAFAGFATRRILLHINNSNPVLIDGSPERRLVQQAGWEIAWDGMEIAL